MFTKNSVTNEQFVFHELYLIQFIKSQMALLPFIDRNQCVLGS